jgi:hypothetical protein
VFSRLATVLRLAALPLALALSVALALALASCGGEDAKLLPGTTATEISENLDAVKQLASEGECIGAADAADQVSAQVEALNGVDPKLKQALERGATRLDEVVTTCEESETEAVAPSREATEETTKTPPGQEKREEREREREEPEAEKKVPTTPTETTPAEPPATTPSESGGTGAPGGVSPAAPAPESE